MTVKTKTLREIIKTKGQPRPSQIIISLDICRIGFIFLYVHSQVIYKCVKFDQYWFMQLKSYVNFDF